MVRRGANEDAPAIMGDIYIWFCILVTLISSLGITQYGPFS